MSATTDPEPDPAEELAALIERRLVDEWMSVDRNQRTLYVVDGDKKLTVHVSWVPS
jgi:hypothetical protein